MDKVHQEEDSDWSTPMKLARTAYFVICNGYSREAYPGLIRLQQLNGMYLGDINHSTQVIPKIRDAAYSHIQQMVCLN